MSIEKVKEYLKNYGFEDRITVFTESSATVALAAKALGCEEARIAKSLTFSVEDKPIMIVCAGDTKVDNAKYKAKFHAKAVMLKPDAVISLVGHAVGGVCPFAVNDGVTVYLDESLKRFDIVYPAAGSSDSAVKLTIEELEKCSGYTEWVDVTKLSQ